MTDLQVKTLVATEILDKMNDKSAAKALRDILFDPKNKIDWNNALQSVVKYMPETILKV